MNSTRQALIARLVLLLFGILGITAAGMLLGQQRGNPAARSEDHQNMMAQLGVRKLRPGPSGNESDPNHANYDEATANPYPDLPEVLTLKNGKKVTSARMWKEQRRPEILEEFDREVLGRVPKNVPKVTWTVANMAEGKVGSYPVIGKQLVGHVDNSSFPEISVDIQMTLVTRADAKGPVPVMMMFGGAGALPTMTPTAPTGRGAAAGADPPPQQQLIADGWGYASINPGSIQADNG